MKGCVSLDHSVLAAPSQEDISELVRPSLGSDRPEARVYNGASSAPNPVIARADYNLVRGTHPRAGERAHARRLDRLLPVYWHAAPRRIAQLRRDGDVT